jgi:hypothetical protein
MPISTMFQIQKGDSLLNKIDNIMYLITDINDKYIKLSNGKGGNFINLISNI